tara:strand:+ start:219 stop:1130 length:912 start_codon:yes stop_codon:yes gene_type:complete
MNTQSKTYLYNIIKSNKDTRKDTTINQYVRSIIKITDNLNLTDIKSLEFLQDTKSIDKFINTIQTISTKRNLYTALLSLIKVNEEDKLYLHYKLKETGLNNKQSKLYDTNKMNDKKTEKYKSISKTDIENMINTLLKENQLQDYILLSLIYNYGYRNEISNLQAITLKDFKRLTPTETKDNNYLVYGSKIFKISRFRFKTDKKYGQIDNDIDNKKLRNVIKKYINTIDTPYLFTNKDTSHYTNQQISNRLSYLTKKYMNTDITGNMIYKISLNDYINTNNKLKEKARIRGQSQSVQSQVYIQS